MAAIEFGIALSTQHRHGDPEEQRFREHVDQVRLARAVGFKAVAAGQHYLTHPFIYLQPIPVLSRIAAEAEGMRLATGALLVPLQHPLDLAEQLATLDVISGGRLIFGAALGYRDVENEAFGLDPKRRAARFIEAVELIERLWTGEAVTHQGEHFQLRDVRLCLRPAQRPRPPIWFAANSDLGVRRAARRSDAWIMNPHATLATLERQMVLFRETRAARGRPAATEIPLGRECYVAPTTARAVAESAPLIQGKYEAYRRWGQDEALPEGESFDRSIEDLAADRFIVGDPARVRDEIARYRDRLGLTHLTFRLQWPGMDQDAVLRSIRLLGEQVLPHFQ